jgi:hypothetical protein
MNPVHVAAGKNTRNAVVDKSVSSSGRNLRTAGLTLRGKKPAGFLDQSCPILRVKPASSIWDPTGETVVKARDEEQDRESFSRRYSWRRRRNRHNSPRPAGPCCLWKDRASSSLKRQGRRLRSWGPAHSLQIGLNSRIL